MLLKQQPICLILSVIKHLPVCTHFFSTGNPSAASFEAVFFLLFYFLFPRPFSFQGIQKRKERNRRNWFWRRSCAGWPRKRSICRKEKRKRTAEKKQERSRNKENEKYAKKQYKYAMILTYENGRCVTYMTHCVIM